MRKRVLAGVVLLLVFSVLAYLPKKALAVTSKTGDNVTISSKDVINDSVFVSGGNVKIDAKVNGDVYCAGQTVDIAGDVSGDVICAAQNLFINGKVDGNLRIAAQNLNIKGETTRNITAVAQTLNSDVKVGRDYFFAGQTINLDGTVGRNLVGGAENVSLGAKVGGDTSINTQNLTLKEAAKISGDLSYESNNDVTVASGASVSGTIVKNIPPVSEKPGRIGRIEKKVKTPAQYLAGRVESWAFAVVISVILLFFFRNFFASVADLMLKEPKKSMLKGFLILVLTPILIVFLCITIIGIPIAIVVASVYALVLALSRIFASVALGAKIGSDYLKNNKTNNAVYLNTIVGVTVIWFLASIPIVRFFVSLFTVIWGAGGVYLYFRNKKSAKA